MMKHIKKMLVGLAVGIAAFALPASALQIQPVRTVLQPGQFVGIITATNKFQRPVPIEVVALRRVVALDGSETLEPADSEFLIFPPQALLQPEQSQAIRFQYIGNPRFDTSQAFVIQVREVPVIPEGVTGVATVFHFGAAVYLRAPDSKVDLRLESVRRDGDNFTLTVRNLGRDWGYLSRFALRISVGDRSVALRGEELSAATANPLAPPLSVREFTVSVPGVPPGEPQVELLLR